MSFGLQNITQVGLHKDGLRIGIEAVMVMNKKMIPRVKNTAQITTTGNGTIKMNPRIKSTAQITTKGNGSRQGPEDPTRRHWVVVCAASRAARINNKLGLIVSLRRLSGANCS